MQKSIPVDAIHELADNSTDKKVINNSDGLLKLNSDVILNSRIHICMPCYNGQVSESTFLSFIKFSSTARRLGIEWSIDTIANESLVCRARNSLVAKFLSDPAHTHLMFIDSDIGWESWHLLMLLHHDLDVVGGLYPLKKLPIKWVVNGLPNHNDQQDLVEVSKAGTGFLLIKRHVFEQLKKHPEVKKYNNDIGLDPALDKEMYNFFDTTIRDDRYYSEDWTFCDNWRQLGGKIHVDKRILLNHTGFYNFSLGSHVKLVEDYGKLYLNLKQGQNQPLVDQQQT